MRSISSTAPVRFKGDAHSQAPRLSMPDIWKEPLIYEPLLNLQGHALAQDAIQKCAQAKTKPEKKIAALWLELFLRKKDDQKQPYIDPNGSDQNGVPLINAAAALGQPELTELLKKHGALSASPQEIKAAQNKLMKLCAKRSLTEKERQEAINTLKTPGMNVNHSNAFGHTALTLASQGGHTEVVQALLKMPDIKVNHPTKSGDTALILASFNRYTEVVQALLKMPDIEVKHALDLLEKRNRPEDQIIIDLLKAHSATTNSPAT